MVDKRYVKLALLTASVLVLNGCSYMGIGQGDFSCPGGIDGVRCMSARQVYQATESSDYVKTVSENDKSGESKPVSVLAHSNSTLNSQVAVPSIEQPVPIRTQAKVMRIWMAPWEDDDGDLHADGYLYTEIESRRWNLGERFRSPGTAISPLSVKTPTGIK
ncbi:type IV conjugative transfer system lipoprotein TraV [Methylomicrobium sp. Wu6]|uniref:type IV conjugative transfer system lipoprotein TraV n=1 Tax=Methylomicrobium sp. Wu6 TaxID=3107928 RepID=UPI002DD63639|nr:type IV conjugative transfer system lipoprotein TraV [Methylomicrobium sp. Wu6]MEC4747583.1 type IV conjugative transfer system lipoprotein TraV [Methylomicrobium sp. Wu6]